MTFGGEPNSARMDVSMIVPTHAMTADLERLFRSVAQSSAMPREILVVDDGSGDDFRPLDAILPIRVVRLAERRGPAAARNEGARQATGEWLLFVDSDILFPPHVLPRVAEILRENPAPVAINIFSEIEKEYGSFWQKANALYEYSWMKLAIPLDSPQCAVAGFWSRTGLIRRDVFLSLGGYNERFTRPTVEDLEFACRFGARYSAAAYRDLRVLHQGRSSFRRTAVKYFGTGKDLVRIMAKRGRFYRYMLNPTEAMRGLSCAALALALALVPLVPSAWPISVCALVVFLLFHRDMFRVLREHGGLCFALAAMAARIPLATLAYAGGVAGVFTSLREKVGAISNDSLPS